jgi:small subunit ribosomal protein S18
MRPSARRPLKKRANRLKAKGIEDVDWKEVTLLRTFVSDRGKIRARQAIEPARSPSIQHLRSGLTPQQQRRVAVAIRNAREMALLPYPHAGRG